jgi:hypothetical protein
MPRGAVCRAAQYATGIRGALRGGAQYATDIYPCSPGTEGSPTPPSRRAKLCARGGGCPPRIFSDQVGKPGDDGVRVLAARGRVTPEVLAERVSPRGAVQRPEGVPMPEGVPRPQGRLSEGVPRPQAQLSEGVPRPHPQVRRTCGGVRRTCGGVRVHGPPCGCGGRRAVPEPPPGAPLLCVVQAAPPTPAGREDRARRRPGGRPGGRPGHHGDPGGALRREGGHPGHAPPLASPRVPESLGIGYIPESLGIGDSVPESLGISLCALPRTQEGR